MSTLQYQMVYRPLNGALTLIKKVWAKFEDMDLMCVCDEHHRKCKEDSKCREYVVKFMEIDRTEDALAHLEKESANFRRDIKKFQSKVSKSIKKFKI
jgi:hypothetical protein